MTCYKTSKPDTLKIFYRLFNSMISHFGNLFSHIEKKTPGFSCYRLCFLLPGFVFFLNPQTSFSQQYTFTHISAAQGLPQKYVYDIIQDRAGYMWIATGEGLCRYDGHEVKTFIGKKLLAENFCTSLFESTNGEIWIGHNQGGITVRKKETFRKIMYSDPGRGPVVGFAEPDSGCVVSALQLGWLVVNCGGKTKQFRLGEGDCYIYSFTQFRNNLLFFTSQGQYLVRFNRRGHPFTQLLTSETWNDEKVQALVQDKRQAEIYWAVTSSGHLLRGSFNGFSKLDLRPVETPELLENPQKIIQASDGTLWIAGFNGVYHLGYNSLLDRMKPINHYSADNGLPSAFVKTVFVDNESNVWFGLYGEGLVALNDEYFTFYRYPEYLSSNDIKSLLILPGESWLGTDNGLFYLDQEDNSRHMLYNGSNGFRTDAVVALCLWKGQIVAGTAANGLFVRSNKTGKWKQQLVDSDNLKNQITDLRQSPEGLWVGTRGGLILLDERFNVVKSWNTSNGLTHNNVNSIYVDKDNSVWITVPANKIAHITNGRLENIEVTGPSQFVDISCITRDNRGQLWIGTYGNGIIVKNGKRTRHLKMSNGLASDYVYSIITGNDNAIWAGHRGSLSRVDPATMKLTVFDQKYGINQDFNSLACFKDHAGNIWFGTSKGVLRFDPTKMRANRNPPRLALKNVLRDDKPLDNFSTEADLPYGTYKFKFNFIGISFTKPQEVRYRYMLKGFDTEWSDLTSTPSATYPKLQEGDYVFRVKAYNAEGFAGKPVDLYHMHISLPVWKRWWFFFIVAAVLIVLVVLIIKIREENQQRMLNLLEKKLAIRTSELIEQKQLVEEQNKDIVDSINYALRIQTAILPEIKLLKKHLPESFVMYKPRDIVSGDFYWFSRTGDRLILACADCTGHGVPGAFMSMIGNTLFNEIVPLCDETDPAQMLYLLDEKMRQLLQHETAESLNDGMDVVLLSLDMQSGELIFSGAVRPVLRFTDGKPHQYRTSRHSIGGMEESKVFNNQRILLKEGDTIYVFSDGFVDQFGGPEKRKLRSKGLTELLYDLQNLSMEEQRFMVEDFFHKWSDQEHQIDDVLLIGFRFHPVTENKETSVYQLAGGLKEEHVVKTVPTGN